MVQLNKRAGFGLKRVFVISLMVLCGGAVGEEKASLEAQVAEAPNEAKPSAEVLKFNIWEYRVEGNRLLGRGLVERTVYPFLGPDKTIDTVETARKTLEEAYHHAGYGTVFVDIPEQDVKEGVVRLNVIEGEVERIRISGARYFSLGKIREQLPALAEGEPPHLKALQDQLAALNSQTSDRLITPVMKPGRSPGKLEVELKVKEKFPLHGSIELNDRYTAGTTKPRLNASLRYDNLWQKGHSATVGYVVSPENRDEVEVFFGTYLFRYGESGNSIALYAVDSSSDVAASSEINQIGAGNIYGLRASFPLPGTGSYFHSLTLGGDFKDFDESTRLLGEDALNIPISYTTFSALYSGIWFNEKSQTSLTVEGHLGMRGLGNSSEEFSQKRFAAKPNFAYLKLALEQKRKWFLGSRLLMKLEGQIADSALISNEQYAVGGEETVRGYFESHELGDSGLNWRLQLSSPSFAKAFLNDLHFLAFYEGASLWIMDPLPGQKESFNLASLGLGMGLSAFDGLSASASWAYALRDSGDIERGDSRVHFKVVYSF